MDNRAIGIYDSGVGGLSVWRAIRERLPNESLLYLGDGKNCPYGLRTGHEIRELAREAVEFLLARGVKMVVVACNTATNAAVESLRATHPDLPIVGLEPAIKPACLNTRSGVVGVLATQSSIEGDMFQRTASKYGDNIEVITRFGQGFVEIVEANKESTQEAEDVVREALVDMLDRGVDQIVLGCTHYPFLGEVISRLAPNATVVDPSGAVARHVENRLNELSLLCEQRHKPRYEFLSFGAQGYIDLLKEKAESIWQQREII